MGPWLIAFVGLIYAAIAVEQALLKSWPMCIVYAGYAFSNVGLYVLAKP